MQKRKPKLVVIVGPTSSGKTKLSLVLAKKFNGVIISADSRQIYRHMDIATAKTTRNQQQGIIHYMIDIADPDEDFTLALYQHTVNNLLRAIAEDNRKRKKPLIPFIVGGTGLYVKAVVNGYNLPAVPPDPRLRLQLEKMPLAKLVARLKHLAPQTTIDLKNKRRVMRAIEILTKQKALSHQNRPLDYDFLQIGISHPKDELHRRINQKVDDMYRGGLVKETKKLLAMGYNLTRPSMSAHGYKHIKKYLDHKITLREALELMKKDTRNYAKRQLTWFKRDPRIYWVQSLAEAEKLVQDFIE